MILKKIGMGLKKIREFTRIQCQLNYRLMGEVYHTVLTVSKIKLYKVY